MEKWYEQVPFEEFGPEFREIADIVGLENAIKLYDRFRKTTVIFSNAPFYRAKKWWIRQNRHRFNPRQMAIMLEVSQRFVYAALEEPEEPTLFD